MAHPETDIDPFEEIRLGRARMEWEWRFRQENLLPMETAYNEGRFFGLLLKGGWPLNTAQRIGVLATATWALMSPGSTISLGMASGNFSSDRFLGPGLIVLLSTLPYMLIGIRLAWVGLRCNMAARSTPERR